MNIWHRWSNKIPLIQTNNSAVSLLPLRDGFDKDNPSLNPPDGSRKSAKFNDVCCSRQCALLHHTRTFTLNTEVARLRLPLLQTHPPPRPSACPLSWSQHWHKASHRPDNAMKKTRRRHFVALDEVHHRTVPCSALPQPSYNVSLTLGHSAL